MRAFRPRIIVNEVRSAEDMRLGFSVRSVCRKYFAIEADYIGYVNHDEAARALGARAPAAGRGASALGRGASISCASRASWLRRGSTRGAQDGCPAR